MGVETGVLISAFVILAAILSTLAVPAVRRLERTDLPPDTGRGTAVSAE